MPSKDDNLKAKVKEQLKAKASRSSNGAGLNESDFVKSEESDKEYVSAPSRFTNRIAKSEDISMFFREMAILLESGYPLMRALSLLGNKTSNRNLAGVIDQVAAQVEKGSSMAKAMAPFHWYFSDMVISMIEAGEASGMLVEALNSIADDFDADDEMSHRIREALAYPLLTAAVAFIVFLAILIFVVPTFAAAYAQHKLVLPSSTAFLVALSNFVTGYWWLWIPLLALAYWAIRRRFVRNAHFFDGLLLRIPIVGEIITLGTMARFSSSLRVLLDNGVPILNSLELAKGSVGNRVIKDVIARMHQSVEAGKSLVQPMAEAGFFPPIMVDMIFVGEESAKLPFVLKQIVRQLRLQLDRITAKLSITLGPIMTLIVGVLVLVIILSLFVPYFSLLSALPDMK